MKEIKLTQGKVALVDDEDYKNQNQWKWFAWSSRGIFYAARDIKINGKQRMIHLHREIMNTPDNLLVDHQDGNGLNCQRFNMRNCTHQQNMSNRKPCGNSNFLGVHFNKKGYIIAQITVNSNTIYLGCFKTEGLAALAYNEVAIKYHGEFANLNIIA